MAKQILVDILDKFEDINSIVGETSKIRDDLKNNSINLKEILENSKKQIKELSDKVTILNDLFHEKYDVILEKIDSENDVNLDESNLNNVESAPVSPKQSTQPLIKLVDIKKLVEPKSLAHNLLNEDSLSKSVHLDDSVVIITSSDEDSVHCRIPNSKTYEKSPKRPLRPRNKKKTVIELKNVSLSDTSSDSSSSSDSYVFSSEKDKQTKTNTTIKSNTEQSLEVDWKSDPRFKAKPYVKLLRIPCEKLKEYYLEKLELLKINRLCDRKVLKQKRKRVASSESDSSQCKSKNKSKKANKKVASESDSSNDATLNEPDNSTSPLIEETLPEKATTNDTTAIEDIAECALNGLNSNAEESSADEAEKDKTTTEAEPNKETPPENHSSSEEKRLTEENVEDPPNSSEPTMKETQKPLSDDGKNDNSNSSRSSWKKDKLLTERLSSSDSGECDKNKMQDRMTSDNDSKMSTNKRKRLVKKKVKKAILSDSDSDDSKENNDSDDTDKKKSSSSSSDSDKEERPKSRRRIKRVRDSSDDEDEKSTRKQIRNIWGADSLAETTKKAEAEEKERRSRILEKQKKYNQLFEGDTQENAKVEKIVLDYDEANKKELLKVADELVSKLKPHQASGVQFMWDACFESLKRAAKSTNGSGCILAHCMGLGKTLQVITLTHTLLINSEKTKVKKVLVVSPLNTVLNWVNEFKQWLPDEDAFEVFELVSFKQNYERKYQVKMWHENGGVLIIGYDMFRNLSNPDNKRLSKKFRSVFQEALVDPGPDLVVCDEGHLLKNEKTNTSIAMNRIKTLRRIVLTGTPLQNNLKEYFCMVQFIKPNLLGTYKEYLNRFVNPIINGQYTDSTPHDIHVMRKRSHVLHKMLDGVVQRRDYGVLQPYLKPKFEYVLFLKLTEVQIKLYQHYMDHFAQRSGGGSNRTSFLFVDFQSLQRICTHPRVLLDKSREMKMARDKMEESDSEGSLKDFINDDDSHEDTSSNSSKSDSDEKEDTNVSKKRMTRAALATAKENGEDVEEVFNDDNEKSEEKEWWQEYCDGDELDVISHSSKLFLLFEILKECEQIGDKVLVFSQSLYSLNVIEYFLEKIHDATQKGETVDGYSGSWCTGLDYFRLDGSSSCDNRNYWCKTFNDPDNQRARLFLISTRAGGLGINLVAANRVIIFDVSWNPSHDIQSIYRVYRFGQMKPCYIYRFVTLGTMEMKIYERQVTKQAISKRVIDEQQIDRHYNQHDLAELYKFEPSPDDRPIPLVPKDVLLGELLQKYEDKLHKYHEHQSLLENKEEECLNEEERKAAWEEFENEKTQRNNWGNNTLMKANNIEWAISNIIRQDNPLWTPDQVKSMIPTLHAQMQQQVAKGDLSLYQRVMQEHRAMQLLREQIFQHQLRVMQQQQQQQTQLPALPNMENWNNPLFNHIPLPSTSRATPNTASVAQGDIIDLND